MVVSVAIPTFNAEAYLEQAVRSALNQTLDDIEVVLVDDCSTDGTFDIARRLAKEDARVVVARMERNGGPAAARNRALDLARGAWFAVLDSDDVMGCDRLERLVAAGEANGADLVADNLIVFDSDNHTCATFFLDPLECSGWVALEAYLQRTIMYANTANLGYLKPIMRIGSLRQSGIRYAPDLRIAEDDDLMVRLLAAGIRYWLEPNAGYAYRRHTGSTSHRLSVNNAACMVKAGEEVLAASSALKPSTREALLERLVAMEQAAAFARLIEALKANSYGKAIQEALRNPRTLPMLWMPLSAALRRALGIQSVTGFGEQDPQAVAVLRRIFDPQLLIATEN